MAEVAVKVAAVEMALRPDRPAVHVRFTAPVDPLSLDRVRLLGRDGEEIAATRQVSLE